MKFMFCCLTIVALAATPVCAQDSPPAASGSEAAASSTNDGDVVIELTKGRRITGELGALSQVKLDTKFGEANIPLGEVDGIKLHIDENDSAVVAFKNGDVVTGQLKLETLEVSTDWGSANVKLASVETILMNKRGGFYQDSSDGKNRWRFGDTREMANTTRRQQQQQQQRPQEFQSSPNLNRTNRGFGG